MMNEQDQSAWWIDTHEPVNLAIDAAAGFALRCLYAPGNARRGLIARVMPAPDVCSREFERALQRIISEASPLMGNRGPRAWSSEDNALRAITALYFHPAIVRDPAAEAAVRRAIVGVDRQ